MNIQQLEYLIAVDKYKHFGKAAQACFITQPTLSAMIQKLEEELDVKIFDRTTHPIRTTDIGLEIISQAKEVIQSVNELRNKASLLNNILAGNLNLGIIPTVSSFLIPDEIFQFLNQHEKITFSIKEMTTENIVKSLKSGELDAGIISTPFEAANEFSKDILFNEELLLYTSEEVGNDTFIAPEDIQVEKVWLLEEGNCLRNQFENICKLKENTLKPKNLELFPSNMSTTIQMVDRVGGVSILPELAVQELSAEQRQKVARFRKPFPYREISIIYYKPTYKQKIIDELVKNIRTSVSEKLNYYQNPNDFVAVSPH